MAGLLFLFRGQKLTEELPEHFGTYVLAILVAFGFYLMCVASIGFGLFSTGFGIVVVSAFSFGVKVLLDD